MDSEWTNIKTQHNHMTPGAESLISAPYSDHSLVTVTIGLLSLKEYQ